METTTKWTKFVNFLKVIWTTITNIASWIASVLEDQGTAGSISSKRVPLGIVLYTFYQMVQGNLAGKVIDSYLLWADISIILVCLGTITAEFFTAFGQNGFNRK